MLEVERPVVGCPWAVRVSAPEHVVPEDAAPVVDQRRNGVIPGEHRNRATVDEDGHRAIWRATQFVVGGPSGSPRGGEAHGLPLVLDPLPSKRHADLPAQSQAYALCLRC